MTEEEKILFMERLWKLSKEEESRRYRAAPPEEFVNTRQDSVHRNPKKKVQKMVDR